MFGLDVDTRRNIRKVIAGFPCIEKVLIYGSRAKGNYKVGSDIDLTLIGKDLTHGNSIDPLMSRLDDLNLPYTFDISIFNKLGDLDLIEHILRVGKTFYRGADSAKWPLEELGEICEINPKKSEVREVNETTVVSFVPMEDLNENQMYFDAKKSKPLKDVYKGYNYFGENDVLLAKVTPCFENGKAGIARGLSNKIGFGSSEFFVLRNSEKVLPEWIYLNILTPNFVSNGANSFTGTSGLRRIPKEFVRSYKIPLPHPDIQKEIVVILDNAFQVIDKAIQNVGQSLKNYQEISDSYLQSLISGKWPMVELGRFCEVVSGQSPKGKYYNSNGEGIPFYQGKAEFGEEYIGEPRKWTSQTTKLAEKGDILMSVRAPVGPVNFATQKICIGRGLAAIRGDSNKINQRYLFFVLKSKRSKISGNVGATFSSISKKGIEKILIPLPHPNIQKEIVRSFDTFNEKYGTITTLAGQKLDNLKNLKESIFQQALNGELTGNNK